LHLKFILMPIGQEMKLIANQSAAILEYLQVDQFSGPQTCLDTSSCEAELIALSRATEQPLYMCCFFQPLHIPTESTQIFTDSQSAMAVVGCEKQSYQPKLKHISIRKLHVADEVAK